LPRGRAGGHARPPDQAGHCPYVQPDARAGTPITMDEEPTQQTRRPSPPDGPTAPLPGGLDPLRGHRPQDPPADDSGATGVLRLDEIFETTEADTDRETPPTWTAMPVVPVRSEPYRPPAPPPPGPTRARPNRIPATTRRLTSDLDRAWSAVHQV